MGGERAVVKAPCKYKQKQKTYKPYKQEVLAMPARFGSDTRAEVLERGRGGGGILDLGERARVLNCSGKAFASARSLWGERSEEKVRCSFVFRTAVPSIHLLLTFCRPLLCSNAQMLRVHYHYLPLRPGILTCAAHPCPSVLPHPPPFRTCPPQPPAPSFPSG